MRVTLLSALSAVLTVLAPASLLLHATPTRAAAPVRIVAFGDSLMAGFGVAPGDALPAQLEAALRSRGREVEVINAGVSGDTAANGLDRFEWAVPADADAVILALGANDALRGLDPVATRATLDAILTRLAARKLPVLIAGMRAPSNWGTAYQQAFDRMYVELAETHGTLLYPFLLEGVALERRLNQPDGLHPTAEGIAEIVRRILPQVEALIAKVPPS